MGMDNVTTKNAKIESTNLGIEDHGILTYYLMLDFGGSGQGFGGWCLDDVGKDKHKDRRVGHKICADHLLKIFETLEVSSWEKLVGTPLRVKASFDKVHAIGHFTKDKWFEPDKDIK